MENNSDPQNQQLLQQVVDGENMRRAWKRVKSNKGAAGVDGRSIETTFHHLREHWPQIRRKILEGTYRPQPVLLVIIPRLGEESANSESPQYWTDSSSRQSVK